MEWRSWAMTRLKGYAPLTAGIPPLLPATSMFGSGSMNGAPAARPFLYVAYGADTPELRDDGKPVANSQVMTVYVHDEPGDYTRIDQILVLVKTALEGQVVDGINGIFAIWQGASPDLADDRFQTIVRNAEFRLVGRL